MPLTTTFGGVSARGLGLFGTVAKLPYQWVAVGQASVSDTTGVIYTTTSTTAASWTSRTSPFGSTSINGVASNGMNLYVAVGDSGKLATSSDGVTWTLQTSSFGTTDINAVAFGQDGYWVAVGGSNKIATSVDGVTWTQRTTGGSSESWVSVAYGSGLWAIFGGGPLRTATDPTGTWTSRTSTLSGGEEIYYDPAIGIWVGGVENGTGTTGALASSSDGLTWTARNTTISITKDYGTFASNGTVLIHAAGTVSTLDIESSTTGTSWTNRSPASTSGGLMNCAASDNLDNIYVVTGAKSQYSTDGANWTSGSDIATGVVTKGIIHSSGMPAIR